MRRAHYITAVLAIAVGIAAGRLMLPLLAQHRAMSAITAADPATRQTGWDWLTPQEDDEAEVRAKRLLERINGRLAGAGDEALLHAGRVLRQADLWDWARQDHELLLRELFLRASLPMDAEQALAVESLRSCPREVEPDAVLPVFNALLADDSRSTRFAAFSAACSWAGRGRVVLLDSLEWPGDETHLDRMRHMALSWAPTPLNDQLSLGEENVDVLEAVLLRLTIATPDDASDVLDVLAAWSESPRPAFEYILRHSSDLKAVAALEHPSDSGVEATTDALYARSRSIKDAQARVIASSANVSPSIRRLAAWSWDDIPAELLEGLLKLDPTDPNGCVYAAALLAERKLSIDQAAEQAERWIRSFNDDEKRAGALLAALIDEHQGLLERACSIEDVSSVRTTQRLSLWAQGRPVGEEDPLEFAYRVLHKDDGDFNADTALCMLLAGEVMALELLTSQPPLESSDNSSTIWPRVLLIERFAPALHEATEFPIGGDARAIALHFDRLEALRLLTMRDTRYDSSNQVYCITP